ncbi:P-loop NTPase fold protein, partial [Pseudomonas ogarae]|uniref:P-loop NTPase fold protein n=2 Tax=Pseudomonas TaxID=286 RepID=UPI0039A51958
MNGLFIRFSTWFSCRGAKPKISPITAGLSVDEIGSESPIRTKSEDRLRRADFASRIATVLSELSLREGRVFAIRGGWGFGKSSL